MSDVAERLTPNQHLDAWLARMADRDEVPPEDRDGYIATMRKTAVAQQALFGFAAREMGFQIAEGMRIGMARLSKALRP